MSLSSEKPPISGRSQLELVISEPRPITVDLEPGTADNLPTFAQDFLYEYGRETANALSLSRPPLAIGAAALTLLGVNGIGAAGYNFGIELTDKESPIARRDHEFGTAQPTIDSMTKLTHALSDVIKREMTMNELLHEINGGWVDHTMDKWAQTIRELALAIKQDIPASRVLVNFLRNTTTHVIRDMYAELGITSANTAQWPGKTKTVLMGADFIMHASGLFKQRKKLGNISSHAISALSLYSGGCILVDNERKYLEALIERGEIPADHLEQLNTFDIAMSGIKRTRVYLTQQLAQRSTDR